MLSIYSILDRGYVLYMSFPRLSIEAKKVIKTVTDWLSGLSLRLGRLLALGSQVLKLLSANKYPWQLLVMWPDKYYPGCMGRNDFTNPRISRNEVQDILIKKNINT